MTVKSALDFEFDDTILAQCDADLARCRIFTRLPSLDSSLLAASFNLRDSKYEDSKGGDDWVEVASTEWKKIRAKVLVSG
jgi:hypothetical protein